MRAWFALEKPDAVSLWRLKETQACAEATGAMTVSFDQHVWGARTTKPTTIMGTLPGLHLLGVRTPIEAQPAGLRPFMAKKKLSRGSPSPKAFFMCGLKNIGDLRSTTLR